MNIERLRSEAITTARYLSTTTTPNACNESVLQYIKAIAFAIAEAMGTRVVRHPTLAKISTQALAAVQNEKSQLKQVQVWRASGCKETAQPSRVEYRTVQHGTIQYSHLSAQYTVQHGAVSSPSVQTVRPIMKHSDGHQRSLS